MRSEEDIDLSRSPLMSARLRLPAVSSSYVFALLYIVVDRPRCEEPAIITKPKKFNVWSTIRSSPILLIRTR